MIQELSLYLGISEEELAKFSKSVLAGFFARMQNDKLFGKAMQNDKNFVKDEIKDSKFLVNATRTPEVVSDDLKKLRSDLHNHTNYSYLHKNGMLEKHLINIEMQYKKSSKVVTKSCQKTLGTT